MKTFAFVYILAISTATVVHAAHIEEDFGAPAPAHAMTDQEQLTLPKVLAPMAYLLYNDTRMQGTVANCSAAIHVNASDFLWETIVETLDFFATFGFCNMPNDEMYRELRQRLHYGFSIGTRAALLVGRDPKLPPPSMPVACYEIPLAIDPAVSLIWAIDYKGQSFCDEETYKGKDTERATVKRPAPIVEQGTYDPEARSVDYIVATSVAGRKMLGAMPELMGA